MDLLRFAWKDIMPKGGAAHASRLSYHRGQRIALHTHDFAEVFWVERGKLFHRLGSEVSGRYLEEGTLMVLHPRTRHTLGHSGKEGEASLVNIAFPFLFLQEVLGEMEGESVLGLPKPDEPLERRLSPHALGHLHHWPQRLTRIRPRGHHVKAFLLDLLMLLEEEQINHHPAWPMWLAGSLREMDSPEGLREGLPLLTRTSGKSREHLSREFKRHVGMTPVRWLQKARVRWAAQALRLENRGVAEVANDVGLSNLGHFYRIFKDEMGCTPREHRLIHRETSSVGSDAESYEKMA